MIFSPDPALYLDPTGRAERICRFVRKLKLWEGRFAGKHFDLKPFQESIIRRIYGPTTGDGRRQVRTACIWIPRGNAKTTLCSALALAHLLGPENEAGGQVVMAAADRNNAGIAFNSSWQMCRQDDALLSRVRPIESRKELHHDKTASKLSAISTEAYSKHGLNCSFFLVDEIHSWPAAEARNLFSVVRNSMIKREQPLTIIISTAGEGQGTLAWDWWKYSHKVASGEIDDPSFAPIIFAADPKEDWRINETWSKCNPAIKDGFLTVEELEIKLRQSQHIPSIIADFKQFHLNLWRDGAAEPWVPLELYDAAEPRETEDDLAGAQAFVGIDMASTTDMAAVSIVWPDGDGGYDADVTGFFPSDNLQARGERDRADYQKWEKDGYLKLTQGNVIDQTAILEHVIELAERFSIKEIVCDRWGSVGFMTRLQEHGFTVSAFGQGFASMNAPVKEMERAILSKKLRHGNNPVLRSAVANVATEKDAAGNVKFTKAKAKGRIDAAVSTVMAIGRAMAGNQASVYSSDERQDGFLML